ncbi:LAFA_0B04390g1_1 [Lachancea sp. 'fantastica']|nr:LAFA_0B04390g1_1 [Lachancea sp. 'fantastica']
MAIGSTLHVSGFPRGVRTRDLAPDFESVGRVVRIEMPPARSEFVRPYAFVEYETPEEAQDALHQLNQRPLSFDPHSLLTVQLARSEARPSRFSGAPDRHHRHGEPSRGDYRRASDYPRGPRGFRPDEGRDDQYEPQDDYRERSRDDFRRQRPGAEDMHYGNTRGSFGHRGPRGYQRPDHAVLRRELSPARVRADDGPAPYQDVLHNNAAALKKPRYEGAYEKQKPEEQSRPNLDVDMYGDEKPHAETPQTLPQGTSQENTTSLPPPPAPADLPNAQLESSTDGTKSATEVVAAPTESSASKTAGTGHAPVSNSGSEASASVTNNNSQVLSSKTPTNDATNSSEHLSSEPLENDTTKNSEPSAQ